MRIRPKRVTCRFNAHGGDVGAIATVKNGCLLFIQPGGGVSASGRALQSAEITRASGDRHRFRIAYRDAYTGVRAYWLDLNFGKKTGQGH